MITRPISVQTLFDMLKEQCARRYALLIRYDSPHRRKWIDAIRRVKQERNLLLNFGEAAQILSAVRATLHIEGDMAELGVAHGASARLIADQAPEKVLHLFDTFEGLPAPRSVDSAKFKAGQFRSSAENVRKYLGDRRVEFHEGLFPATASAVADRRFSFLHLDVDLYESTLAGLEFFYPRMSRGGIIISHDFVSADGVNLAFQEFFTNKPDPVVELTGYQCMVVKL